MEPVFIDCDKVKFQNNDYKIFISAMVITWKVFFSEKTKIII